MIWQKDSECTAMPLLFFVTSAPLRSSCRRRHNASTFHAQKSCLNFETRRSHWQATAAPPAYQTLFTSSKHLNNFLTTTWGKRPCLFRKLLPSFDPPLTPDELAGLSCIDDVNSRIIQGKGTGPYSLRLGPFDDDTFSGLPETDWTLLVHDANQHVPELSDLLDQFSFIPNWRVDDVMVSYAAPGGSVGPHVDNYDVFLVQGSGRRKWQVSYSPIAAKEEQLLEDCDVRVLRDGFVPDEEWILEQGDVLYVPPRFPHYGISLDDMCMTYSVGFRAPALGDVVCGWAEEIVESGALQDVFYEDDVRDLVANVRDPGRISSRAAERMYEEVVRRFVGDEHIKQRFVEWFSREVTMPKRFAYMDYSMSDEEAKLAVQNLFKRFEHGEEVVVKQKDGASFAYVGGKKEVSMYVDGQKWEVQNAEIAQVLCKRRITVDHLAELDRSVRSLRPLLENLFAAGLLYVDTED